MTNFYQVLDNLRETLIASDFTNTVTFGDFTDIDLDKKTNFPLVHIVVRDSIISENYIDFTVDLICADIVDIRKEIAEDKFLGNDNVQDILAAQMKVMTDITNYFRRNDFVVSNFITVQGDVSANPFLEKFNNMLAGWEGAIVLRSAMQDKC